MIIQIVNLPSLLSCLTLNHSGPLMKGFGIMETQWSPIWTRYTPAYTGIWRHQCSRWHLLVATSPVGYFVLTTSMSWDGALQALCREDAVVPPEAASTAPDRSPSLAHRTRAWQHADDHSCPQPRQTANTTWQGNLLLVRPGPNPSFGFGPLSSLDHLTT